MGEEDTALMSIATNSFSSVQRMRFLQFYCNASAIGVSATGGLILCGWAFHIEMLKSVLPGGVAIKPNMALLLVLSGTSLWLLLPGDARPPLRYIARVLAMLVTVIGAATRMEYLVSVNLGIDQLLFSEPAGAAGDVLPWTHVADVVGIVYFHRHGSSSFWNGRPSAAAGHRRG